MSREVDDGWELEVSEPEPDPGPEVEHRTGPYYRRREEEIGALLREALLILDGEAPEEIALAGDGWSLIDPEPDAAVGTARN